MDQPPKASTQGSAAPVADARGNWVDSLAPATWRPYLRLARLDRPIGTWLLLLPGWWALALAAHHRGPAAPDWWLVILFGIGAIAMRGAGCTYNDIVDREFDGRVARTRSRPIPSGQVSVGQAKAFMIAQCLVGLAVLVQFNAFAITVGAFSLVLIAVYPFMKRVTWWPQFFLGLAFNWGALLGWAAVTGSLQAAPVVLYAAGIAWTLGYDTIYAHQDKEDDLLIGIRSTALRLGSRSSVWIAAFFAATTLGILLVGAMLGMGAVFYAGVAIGAGHLAWQVATLDIDDPGRCLRLFRSNRDYGLIIFLSIIADALT